MRFEEITLSDLEELAAMYVESFNAPPWNDEWTMDSACKRIQQMVNCEDFYGLKAYQEDILCGMIFGNEEQFFDGIMFNIKEFCVRTDLQKCGLGSQILSEFENRLRKKGIKEIMLFTSRGNGTEEFYHKRGLQSYDSMVMMGKQL